MRAWLGRSGDCGRDCFAGKADRAQRLGVIRAWEKVPEGVRGLASGPRSRERARGGAGPRGSEGERRERSRGSPARIAGRGRGRSCCVGPGRQRAGEREVRGGLKRGRPGRAEEPAGPACWARAGEGKGRLGHGERVLGWLGRGRRKNGPWGKDGLGCFGFGSSFHFYFFFFCKLTQTSLNSNKFEFKLPSTQPK